MIYAAKARQGFSLIEIVIAISIVGLMGALAVGAIQYLRKAARTATDSNLQSLKLSIQSFNSDTGSYPARLDELLTRPADPKISKRWRGPYLEKEVEDGWKHPFVYQLNPKGSAHPFELYSWGPNGEGSAQEEQISVWE
jgi:general secretion pathway protein G